MKKDALSLAMLSLVLFVGCSRDNPKSSYGFTLPEGDATVGKELFVSYSCHECHTVSATSLPDPTVVADKRVTLGGEVTRIQTYGELVTSIINPSHKLAVGYKRDEVADEGESTMTNYNDVMSVSELINLVAFLQSRYRLKPYEPTAYDMYMYGS